MKKRIVSIVLSLLLTLGALPAVGFAVPKEDAGFSTGESSIYIDPVYGVFIEDDSDYCDTVTPEEAANTKGAVSNWELENSIWLDALAYTGYPVQKLHDAGLLFNANITGWYYNHIYKLWKGMGLDETEWTLKQHYPTNYGEAVSAWSQTNVPGSHVCMASVASAGGTEGLHYKGYAASTVTFGCHTAGAGVAYQSGSSAVMEKPSNWKRTYQETDQGFPIQRGIVCASMVTYVYFNYLPSVKNWTRLSVGNNWHYKSTSSPYTLGGLRLPYGTGTTPVVAYNSCTCIDWGFSHSTWAPYVTTGNCSNRTDMISILDAAVPGTILLFKYGEVENGEFITPDPLAHAAIYLGKVNGSHYVLHNASIRGPEIQTVDTKLVREDPPLLSRYITPPPYVRVKLTSDEPDALADVQVTVTYKNPGAAEATWTGKSVRKTDRDGKAYGEVLMPMCYIKENASVTVKASKGGVSFPDGSTTTIMKVQYGENLVQFKVAVNGRAAITVNAANIKNQTYHFTLTETKTGTVRTADSRSDGTVRVTDNGPATSDKTSFMIDDGSYRLTELNPGLYRPSSIKVTEISAGGTKTVLGTYTISELVANGPDAFSYATPVFQTSTLSKGGRLLIEVVNKRPNGTGELTGVNGTHETPSGKSSTLRDTVSVDNLVPGHGYQLRGYLVDLKTGERIKQNGEYVMVQTNGFTATSKKKTLKLNFTVDLREYAGHTLAVQEYLFDWTLNIRAFQYSNTDDTARQVLVNPKLATQNPFVDVPNDAWYTKGILWAYENDIVEGYDATHFGPELHCNRASAIGYLWRAKGCPKPKSNTMPYTDVPTDAWFSEAIIWATEKGITCGTDATKFSPYRRLNRAEYMTFMWRAAGKPEPKTTTNPFTDVRKKDFFYKAVLWAVEKKITEGVTPTTFAPMEECTRAHVMTFLYRYVNGKNAPMPE